MEWEITFDGITYECINCAYCCSCEDWRIYLNYFDVLRLEDYAYAIEDCEGGKFKKRLKVNEGGCVLLHNNLCKIHLEKGYEYKPLMCKIFPFSFMVKWNGDLLLIIKHYCKGIKKGKCDKKMIKKAIEYCEELYLDELDDIIFEAMEHSSKTKIDEDWRVSWEEREEFGRCIFKSKSLDEIAEKCKELINYDVSERINRIKDNLSKLEENIRKENEEEIIRFLRELNKREHFRKLPFKKEIDKLLEIGERVSRYKNVFKGECIIDKELLLNPTAKSTIGYYKVNQY
jgi:Fe-S-cluster containining protein